MVRGLDDLLNNERLVFRLLSQEPTNTIAAQPRLAGAIGLYLLNTLNWFAFYRYWMDVNSPVPSLGTMVTKLFTAAAICDVIYASYHRIQHEVSPWLYARFHKRHHQVNCGAFGECRRTLGTWPSGLLAPEAIETAHGLQPCPPPLLYSSQY